MYGFVADRFYALTASSLALGVHRIYANRFPDNIGSIKVLEKVGLVCEGRLRENTMSEGKYSDANVFGIFEQEWNTNR